jgi:hypothetical protein
VIYSEDYEQHLRYLDEVFTHLRSAGLTVNPGKVVLAGQEIMFLGHHVSPSGISIDPERTRAKVDFPPPLDVKGFARFIGMMNFYHKFIPRMADIAAPLNCLRKKGVKFLLGQPQQEAFERLKQAISQQPILRMVDFSKPFVHQTDASGRVLAAVLLQDVEGGRKPRGICLSKANGPGKESVISI